MPPLDISGGRIGNSLRAFLYAFAALSGSSPATVAAVGSIAIEMVWCVQVIRLNLAPELSVTQDIRYFDSAIRSNGGLCSGNRNPLSVVHLWLA